jgi:hypothetical protein
VIKLVYTIRSQVTSRMSPSSAKKVAHHLHRAGLCLATVAPSRTLVALARTSSPRPACPSPHKEGLGC